MACSDSIRPLLAAGMGKAKSAAAVVGRKERKGKNRPRPGRTGIRNLGNTCYMSSIVQSLASIPKFRDIIMNYQKYSTDSPEEEGCVAAT